MIALLQADCAVVNYLKRLRRIGMLEGSGISRETGRYLAPGVVDAFEKGCDVRSDLEDRRTGVVAAGQFDQQALGGDGVALGSVLQPRKVVNEMLLVWRILVALLIGPILGCAASGPASATSRPTSQPADVSAALDRYIYEQPEMGTLFRLVVWAANKNAADAAAAAAWARVEELNRILSDYDPQSELSRLCALTDQGPMTQSVEVGPDLWTVLSTAIESARLSEGAFDITVGPLTRLQRQMRKTGQMPTTQQLEEAKASVGWESVQLNASHHTVQLMKRRMRLDVGGIAKGYTSSKVLKRLRELGITRVLCGAAGDISAGDPPPGKQDWIVGIQSLTDPSAIAGHVKIHNYSVSTSGDLYRGADVGGQRFSHIIDPRTGLGITHKVGVTALAPEGITADWITKPLSILEPEKALDWVERIPGAAARIVTVDDNGQQKVYESKRFKDFLLAER